MRINPLLMTIFLFINTSFCLNASFNIIWHYKDLDLCLFKHGVSSFVDMSKETSDSNYIEALWNITKVASKNERKASSLLEDIHNNLKQKIERIKYLENNSIEHNKTVDGLGQIALGIAGSYLIYYFFKEQLCPLSKKFNDIKKSLENLGIKVNTFNGIQLRVPFGLSSDKYTDAHKELIKLSDKREFIGGCLGGGGIISVATVCKGLINIHSSLYPNHDDDRYLEKYHKLLEITKRIKKCYALQCE